METVWGVGCGKGSAEPPRFVYICRDQLKLLLDSQQSSGEALNTDAGLFRFRSKTVATVASNNRLTSGDVVTAKATNSLPRQGMCTT